MDYVTLLDLINETLENVLSTAAIFGKIVVASAKIAFMGDIPSASKDFEEAALEAKEYLSI